MPQGTLQAVAPAVLLEDGGLHRRLRILAAKEFAELVDGFIHGADGVRLVVADVDVPVLADAVRQRERLLHEWHLVAEPHDGVHELQPRIDLPHRRDETADALAIAANARQILLAAGGREAGALLVANLHVDVPVELLRPRGDLLRLLGRLIGEDGERERQLHRVGHLRELLVEETRRARLEPVPVVGRTVALLIAEEQVLGVRHGAAPAEERQALTAEGIDNVLAAADLSEDVRRLVGEIGVVDPDLALARRGNDEPRLGIGDARHQSEVGTRPVLLGVVFELGRRIRPPPVRPLQRDIKARHTALHPHVSEQLPPFAAGHAPAIEPRVPDTGDAAIRHQHLRTTPQVLDLLVLGLVAAATQNRRPLAAADLPARSVHRAVDRDQLGGLRLLEALIIQPLCVEPTVDLVVDVLHARAVERARHLGDHLVGRHGDLDGRDHPHRRRQAPKHQFLHRRPFRIKSTDIRRHRALRHLQPDARLAAQDIKIGLLPPRQRHGTCASQQQCVFPTRRIVRV